MSKPDLSVVQKEQNIIFGGLDGEEGAYCIPPQTIESLAGLMPEFPSRGMPKILRAGLDPLRLAEAGWGVVWAPGTSEATRQAMAPLLEWRHGLAGPLFRELEYFTEESIFDFLERFDAGPDSVEPAKVPYYLLLVGSPDTLPFDLQSELAVSRAVGRISFESAEGYADYAERIVEYESQQAPSQRTAAFFGVENRDDLLTSSSVENFIKPLEQMLAEQRRSWGLETYLRHAASAARRICRASAEQDVETHSLNLHDFKLWAAYEDARGYILVGDPAACIHV